MVDNFRNFDDNDVVEAAQQREMIRERRRQQWRKFGSVAGPIVLGVIGFGGLISLAIASQKDNQANFEYRFNGVIDGEQVYFHESWSGSTNYLDVTKADGSSLYFVDKNDDLKIDSVQLKSGTIDSKFESGGSIYTSNSAYVQENLDRGQAVFDSYLKKIGKMNSIPLDAGK
jgi:hypothetical protein